MKGNSVQLLWERLCCCRISATSHTLQCDLQNIHSFVWILMRSHFRILEFDLDFTLMHHQRMCFLDYLMFCYCSHPEFLCFGHAEYSE